MSLSELQQRLEAAQAELSKAINRAYPPGYEVTFERGRGVVRGVVYCKTFDSRVRIRHASGHMHHVHWTNMIRLGDLVKKEWRRN